MKNGVYVFVPSYNDDLGMTEEEHHYAEAKQGSVGQHGELYVIEEVPDLDNSNDGNPKGRVCAVFASGSWERCEMVD
mgnify:CR=1 FL=1